MKRKIAVPIENGKLCAHFGHCEKFAIIEICDDVVTEYFEETPPEHVPGLYPQWVASFGVTDVIAGGMGEKAISLFNQQSINAFVGAPMLEPMQIVKDFMAGSLTLDANYCNHDEKDHHGACGH
ncbi:MAG TPA: NifB/NifX family molybdenum-iron cluster-binding protein [Bacteroidales bacterium]|nr:NifB/NifX family molybdenum-iron cluster-binding protein [Bacteroidales bacterium]